MDNMAYLQQIASGNNTPAKKPSKSNFLFEKVLTIRNGIIALVCIVIIIVIAVISSATNTVDNKDQELLETSWLQSSYLIGTLDGYQKFLKSSNLRAMSSSLNGVLKEITLTEGNLLQSVYGIDMKKAEKSSSLAESEKAKIANLNATLENGRLNGILDRTFAREITMQIAYLISYQSECGARTSSEKVVEATNKAKSNLNNIYNQFKDYQDLSN